MYTLRVPRIVVVIAATAAAGALACSGNPDAGDAAYKQGSLGNGGFLFGCADGVACKPFSGDAKKFPTSGVAAGSTFGVRFVPNDDQGNVSRIDFANDGTDYDGVTVSGLEPFFRAAPTSNGGILASQPGAGTLIAKKSDGTIFDFISMKVVQATKLVVYDADQSNPLDTTTISLSAGSAKRLRIVGQDAAAENLAGSIPVSWTFSDGGQVAKVDHTDDGVSTFAGLKSGAVTVQLDGGGLKRTIPVEVK